MGKPANSPIIYAAVSSCGWSKIGVSKQLKERLRQHRYSDGEHVVIRTWRHPRPHTIELMVCRDLYDYRARGKEWFAVPGETLVKCVERAIRQYRAGKRPLTTGQVVGRRAAARRKAAAHAL